MLKILCLFYLFFSIAYLPSQETYAINQYGTYIISSERIIQIPSEYEALILSEFWENYAIFIIPYSIPGMVIFNIENNFIRVIRDERLGGVPKILEDAEFFTIYQGGYIVRLDWTSLEIIEITYVGRLYNLHYDLQHSWEIPMPVNIRDRVVCYESPSHSISIVYRSGIDIDRFEDFYFIYDTFLNQYAIRATLLPDR